MNYPRIWGSNYSSECIAVGTRRDVDDTVINLVNQYNTYMKQGDIKMAGTLFNANRTALEPYLINTRYLNYLEEEVYNTGITAFGYGNKANRVIVTIKRESTASDHVKFTLRLAVYVPS